ncbi:hypothetical protein [Streptomyces pseudovenezuelae]|nr:hypothetical protein [Streptomyces pseudovenezuelae]
MTVSLTTTTAPPDLVALNRATGALLDHALCAKPSKPSKPGKPTKASATS